MGLFDDIPGILAEVHGQGALQWRAVVGTGTYADLDGARLSNRREEVVFDTDRQREHLMQVADLSVPSTSDPLYADYEIHEVDGTTWAVRGKQGDADAGVTTYGIMRDPTKRYGPNKGHV